MFDPGTFTLDNGLQVVVVENRRAPIVVHAVWYKVGAADEPPGKSGIAHFLEHLMFKGTPSVPSGAFSRIVAENGGSDNAFTSQDYTAYVQRVASDKLELVMRMEADRMVNLRLTEEKATPERGVVREERRTRTGNSPGAQLYERRRAVTYLRHPYRIPVIGWKSEIDGLTARDALAFYRAHYAPNNAILIVAGDTTVDEVRRLARKHYGPVPRRKVPERTRAGEPDQLAAKRVTLKSPRVHVPSVSITWRAPSFAAGETRHAYPLLLLADLLGGGSTSRLHRRLVIEEKIRIGAPQPDILEPRSTWASSRCPLRRSPAEISTGSRRCCWTRSPGSRSTGSPRPSCGAASGRCWAAAIYARDGLGAAPRVIGRALTTGRTIADVEAWPERIAAVDAAAVRDAARAVFVERRSVTAVLLPEPAG